MKKLLIVVLLVVSASSCVLQKATSSFKDVTPESVFEYPVIADLQIGDKISYHYVPEDIIRKRLTKVELIESAIAATLKENGNADVLLYPQYVFKYVEGSNIKTITVTGYPAKYVFRKVNDNFRKLYFLSKRVHSQLRLCTLYFILLSYIIHC